MQSAFIGASIRQRLWTALAMLALSTLLVGAIAWAALSRAEHWLGALHGQTLAGVARALDLSTKSSDLATSAPFLLNLNSPYLIVSRAEVLQTELNALLKKWNAAGAQPGDEIESQIATAAFEMRLAVDDLVKTSLALHQVRDAAFVLDSKITQEESQLFRHSTDLSLSAETRKNWFALQAIASDLASAGHAENLLGVGEYQRKFLAKVRELRDAGSQSSEQQEALEELEQLALNDIGLFEVRRRELEQALSNKNALFRIGFNARQINDLAERYAIQTEAMLVSQSAQTQSAIGWAKSLVLLGCIVSVIIALASSAYVSRHIVVNIKAISDAMMRLVQGDRSAKLGRKISSKDEIGKLGHAFRVFRITARRLDRSNRQLNQKNALFESVFASISEGLAISSEGGHLTEHNDRFSKVLGLGRIAPGDQPLVYDLFAAQGFNNKDNSKSPLTLEDGYSELSDGNARILEVRRDSLPDGRHVWLVSDVTERRMFEERLHQIEHIERLGKVAGEVAHDFGNVLSTIGANVHMLETDTTQTPPHVLIRRVENAVELGRSMSQRLLAFARQQQLSPKVVDLNAIISGVVDLVEIGIKPEVCLSVNLPAAPLTVSVDPGQLENAILNLCLNSNQAIERRGAITISLTRSEPKWAEICVTDNGAGMDKATLKRCLEPFFTARKGGNGTGLGLSSVYGFISQTGGDILIESEKGKGTSVRLRLPLELPAAEANFKDGRRYRVLLVDDEPAVLADTTQLLNELGHKVTAVSTFEAAQAALQQRGDFEVLITDLQLDEAHSGWDLVRVCQSRIKTAKIIVASGKLPEPQAQLAESQCSVVQLKKPLTRAAIANGLLNKHE